MTGIIFIILSLAILMLAIGGILHDRRIKKLEEQLSNITKERKE